MISSKTEYLKAREELQHLTHWLSRLENEKATVRKSLTTASIRKMISRLQEELAEYEAAAAQFRRLQKNGLSRTMTALTDKLESTVSVRRGSDRERVRRDHGRPFCQGVSSSSDSLGHPLGLRSLGA